MTKTEGKSREADLSGIHLWLVLWKAGRAVEAQAQRSIARFGMVMSDFGVLEALLHRGPLNAKQLGAKVLLTSGSVTAAVDRLAARGLVRASTDHATGTFKASPSAPYAHPFFWAPFILMGNWL